MTREQFMEIMDNAQLDLLLKAWQVSGHSLKLTPTVDRINSASNYEKGNIQWLTLSQNASLGGIKSGLKRGKKIQQIGLDGTPKNTFKSASEASMELFGSTKRSGNISACALNKIPSAYGFKWNYLD